MTRIRFEKTTGNRMNGLPSCIPLRRFQRGHSRVMMVLCIGIPVLAVAVMLFGGMQWVTWSTALFLLCPVMMGAMMLMMMRDQRRIARANLAGDSSSRDNGSPDEPDTTAAASIEEKV